MILFFFKQKTAYEMRSRDWSSDVCSSDLNAKATSKDGAGDAKFWGRLLAARIYFSGLVDEIDYITAYPGHSPTSNETVISEALNILGQSLRKSYLPDLILRHPKAVK